MTTPAFSPSHGSRAEVYYNGHDISVYLSTANAARERDKADAATFKSKVKRYTYGLSEPTMTLEGYFQGSQGAVDELMSAAIDAGEGAFSHFPTEQIGGQGKSIIAISTKYEITSEIGATVGVSMEASAGPLGVTDNVRALAFGVEVAAAGNGQTLDFGSASSSTGALIVHGSTTGGSMDVTLQDSTDGVTFADVATLNFTGGTTEAPLRAGKRAETTTNVRRYVRVIWSGAGEIAAAAVGRKR